MNREELIQASDEELVRVAQSVYFDANCCDGNEACIIAVQQEADEIVAELGRRGVKYSLP